MKQPKNHLFPALVAIFSITTLCRIIMHPTDIYGMLSVLTGTTGIILYYKGHLRYDAFFYAWIYLQVPDIYFMHGDVVTPVANAFPGVFLLFNLSVGVMFGLKNGTSLYLYINLLPIALYYTLKYINVAKPIGRSLSISRLRKGTFSQISFPVKGIIEKVSGRNKLTAVYLIKTDTAISIKDKTYSYILLEPKNDSLIQPNGKWQVCALRLCDVPDLAFNEKQHRFVDWVTVSCE